MFRSSSARRLCAGLLLWVQLGPALAIPSAAHAADAGKKPLQTGQEFYDQSRFDDAISLLRDLVDHGQLQGDELIKAREILARSYVKKGYPIQAKEMFKAILHQDPAYRPDPIRIPPDETRIFELALKEYDSEQASPTPPIPTPTGTGSPGSTGSEPAAPAPRTTSAAPAPKAIPLKVESEHKKPLLSQWWVWALGAVVVGGGIAAAGGGGGGNTTTPPPSSLPNFPNPPGR
jgi:hypothetical protein